MFSCKATQRSTQALGAAQGACAAERFTGAHPPSRAGPLSDYKVAVDASVRRRSGRMCHRKVRWRSSFPAELGPFFHKATDGHAFRRHMRPELFASQGFAHAFIPSGVDSRGFPSSLLHRNVSHGCITPASS